jgi:hypothetical protein
METQPVFKTLAFDSTLTWLFAQETFITFMRHETIKTYTVIQFLAEGLITFIVRVAVLVEHMLTFR